MKKYLISGLVDKYRIKINLQEEKRANSSLSIAKDRDPPVASIGSRIKTFLFSKLGKFS